MSGQTEEGAKKTEVPGMFKVREGIVINKDSEALQAYKKRKRRNQKIDELEQQITELRNDLSEIKNLILQQLKR